MWLVHPSPQPCRSPLSLPEESQIVMKNQSQPQWRVSAELLSVCPCWFPPPICGDVMLTFVCVCVRVCVSVHCWWCTYVTYVHSLMALHVREYLLCMSALNSRFHRGGLLHTVPQSHQRQPHHHPPCFQGHDHWPSPGWQDCSTSPPPWAGTTWGQQ